MSLTPESEELLAEIHMLDRERSSVALRKWSGQQMAHQVEGLVGDRLMRIEAAAEARGREGALAEVARLREAAFRFDDFLENEFITLWDDALTKSVIEDFDAWEQAEDAFHDAVTEVRAALAAAGDGR